jgi:hypothetical protein
MFLEVGSDFVQESQKKKFGGQNLKNFFNITIYIFIFFLKLYIITRIFIKKIQRGQRPLTAHQHMDPPLFVFLLNST